MNKLPATIKAIHQSGTILLVDAEVEGQVFSAMMIEAAQRPVWLIAEHSVDLVFKETEVTLARDLSGKISTRNRMWCKILKINKGELLSMITLKYKGFLLTSAITSRSSDMLKLEPGDKVEALVKANEVSLMKKSSRLQQK